MHSEQCNLSHWDVRHSLTHKGEEEGGECVCVWGGDSFLIEFPDNTEINLTPVKFDYISVPVLSCSPIVKCMCLFSLFLFPLPLALFLFVSAVPSKHY